MVLTPTNSGTFYFDKQQLRMYSIIGGHASLQGRRISYTQGAPGSADYEVWFTGYQLPSKKERQPKGAQVTESMGGRDAEDASLRA